MLIEIEDGEAAEWREAVVQVLNRRQPVVSADPVARDELHNALDADDVAAPLWSTAALLSSAGLQDVVADALLAGKSVEQASDRPRDPAGDPLRSGTIWRV